MPRTRQQDQYEQTQETIKAIARRHMAEAGSAALSLRAIARDMEVTAPALYRYYPSLDHLLTALILDAFNALAEAMEAADAAQPSDDFAMRLAAVMRAYRDWALAHSIDFQLIYGTPIPGYHAPRELTVPAAVRGYIVIGRVLGEADWAGRFTPPAHYAALPETVSAHLQGLIAADNYPVSPTALYVTTAIWTRMHGLVMLELNGHSGPTVGDTQAFYNHEIAHLVAILGLSPPA